MIQNEYGIAEKLNQQGGGTDMEKKPYETPELEIVRFEAADIITVSPGENDLEPDMNN